MFFREVVLLAAVLRDVEQFNGCRLRTPSRGRHAILVVIGSHATVQHEFPVSHSDGA